MVESRFNTAMSGRVVFDSPWGHLIGVEPISGCQDTEHEKTLFIFNDNEEQFDAFIGGLDSGYTLGAGNAVARPWRKLNPPKSAGIPTGKLGSGYQLLDPAAKEKIEVHYSR